MIKINKEFLTELYIKYKQKKTFEVKKLIKISKSFNKSNKH